MPETPATWWAKQLTPYGTCPVCAMKAVCCLSVDVAKGAWHCAHCHASGTAVSWLQLTAGCSPEAAQKTLDDAGLYPQAQTTEHEHVTERMRVHEAIKSILGKRAEAWIISQHIQHVAGDPKIHLERIAALLARMGLFTNESQRKPYDYRQSPSMQKALPEGCGLRGMRYFIKASALKRQP